MLQLNDFKPLLNIFNEIENKVKQLFDFKKISEVKISHLEKRVKNLENEIREMQHQMNDFVRKR